MITAPNKKIKISLGDYPYKKDIANRLFLAKLSPFEVNALHELFYFGSKFTVSDLIEALDCSEAEIVRVIDIFSRMGLVLQQDETVFIDKDARKYFEGQIPLFEESFAPDLDYFQKLLKKVPISALPLWYNLPKTLETIFSSIVEKYLSTPKLYEKHLAELVFEEPLCRQILDRLFLSPTLEVSAATLKDELKIPKEKFEECLLQLEFHIAAVATYRLVDDKYEQVVVAFKEYGDFERHNRAHLPKPITGTVTEIPHPPYCAEPFKHFRKALDELERQYGASFGPVEKSVREVEKACRLIPANSWVLLDDCIRWMHFPVGMQEAIQLKKVGKKWAYPLPVYDERDKEFIKQIITSLFFEMGLTACGHYEGKECFMITAYGKMTLGD
jgi:hypothetical protein